MQLTDIYEPWRNFSWQDEPFAELSTLEAAACHSMLFLHSVAIRPNLELKTRSIPLLGSLPLDIALPEWTQNSNKNECHSVLSTFQGFWRAGANPKADNEKLKVKINDFLSDLQKVQNALFLRQWETRICFIKDFKVLIFSFWCYQFWAL